FLLPTKGAKMSEEIVEPQRGLSRRTMIKRVGAGAAVAWAAPSILTVAQASAASPAAVACSDCGTDVCFSQGTCAGTCPCSPLLSGACRCWGPAHGACDDFFGRCDPAGANNGDGDCPSGSSCVPTCCYSGGQTGVCVPPCGAGGLSVKIPKPGSLVTNGQIAS